MNKTIEEFKQNISGKKSLDELTMAILYATELNEVRSDLSRLHVAFYEILEIELNRQTPLLSQLRQLHYNIFGLSPYSREFDQILSALSLSNIISIYTGKNGYSIMEHRNYMKERYDEFNDEEKLGIKEAADIVISYQKQDKLLIKKAKATII